MKGGETMKQYITVSVIAIAVVGAGLFGVSHVSAQDADSHDTLVQKIAQKFNLNQEEVKAVFDEHRTERVKIKHEKMDERLNQLVSEGEITEEQKVLIQNKLNEQHAKLKANMESLKDVSREERREAFQKEHEALRAWAMENNIDLSLVRPTFKMKFRHADR